MMRDRFALSVLAIGLVLAAGCEVGEKARGDAGQDPAAAGDPSGADPAVEAPPPPEMTESEMPFAVGDATAHFYSSVPYGPEPAQLFDLIRVESATPTPLAIFIHGGGFTGGSRLAAWKEVNLVTKLLGAGISVATIDYTLLPGPKYAGVIQCLSDARRALQFLRWQAPNLNVDPGAIVLFGESAGAGTSLWLAFSDDMADPADPDPVARQSTRVRGAAVFETQSTYDIVRWEEVLAKYGLDLETRVADDTQLLMTLLVFYGIGSVEDLYTPALVEYRSKVDMLGRMSADDPPFWMRNTRPDEAPVETDLLLHHPLHGKALVDRAAEVGVAATAYIPGMGISASSGLTAADFLIARAKPQAH
jgi:acetyl esterase/lipase